jgi:ketosteroid isomerase-like protein
MKAMTTLILLLAASATAMGQSNDAQKSKIIAMENAWNMAEQSKDAKALNELLSDNLIYVDYDGSTLNKSRFLENVRRPTIHPEQIVNEAMQVYVYGTAAVVAGTYREKGTDKGKTYSRRVRFTDTWVYANDVWQCVAGQLTLISH